MIAAYLDTGEGMFYSGALSYQGAGFLLVRGIDGCFYNLKGFPAPRFYQEYAKIAHLIV
jgi:septum formation protein